MERVPFAQELEEDEFEDDEKLEKSKKNRKFIRFLSIFSKEKKQNEGTSPDAETHKIPKRSILDIIKLFQSSPEGKTDEIPQAAEHEEKIAVRAYVDESLDESIEKMNDDSVDEAERDSAYVDSLILSKIKERLDNDTFIDLDEILLETALEIENEPDAQAERIVNSKETEIITGQTHYDILDQIERVDAADKHNTEESYEMHSVGSGQAHNPSLGASSHSPVQSAHSESGPSIALAAEMLDHDQTKDYSGAPAAGTRPPIDSRPHSKPNIPLSRSETNADAPGNSSLYKNAIRNPEVLNFSRERMTTRVEQKGSRESTPNSRDIINLSYGELLQLAERVFVDGVSLRHIYERSNLTKEDLRNILVERLDKKKLNKNLNKTLKQRNNSYESIIRQIKKISPPVSSNATRHQSNLSGHLTADKGHLADESVNLNKKTDLAKSHSTSKKDYPRNKPLLTIAILLFVLIVALLYWLILD